MQEELYYSKRTIEQVKAKSDLISVIEKHIPTERHGENARADCPFHEGKGGMSLLISGEKQTWVCTDCGESGDVFSFLMKYNKMSFRESVEYLAAKEGIRLPKLEHRVPEGHQYASQQAAGAKERVPDSPEAGAAASAAIQSLFQKYGKAGQEERDSILKINLEAARYYHQNLSGPDRSGLDYIHGRGISDRTIRQFGIGYAPNGKDSLYRHLLKKGYPQKELQESGLFTFYGDKAYDKFRGRVMCPVVDTERNVLGFSGRAVGDETPKYKNSPSTVAFDKKTVLYGLNIAQHASRSDIILCEGNMDVISLHQAGFNNAVASLGTAFSKEHAMILSNYTDRVHLVFDSDGPGIKAALKAIPILREQGVRTDVVHLDPYKDPDEFIRAEGAHSFQSRIDQAEGSMEFELRNTYGSYDLDDKAQREQMLKEFSNHIIGLDERLMEEYMRGMENFLDGHGWSAEPEAEPGGQIKAINSDDVQGTGGENSVERAYVDMSWLDEYTL